MDCEVFLTLFSAVPGIAALSFCAVVMPSVDPASRVRLYSVACHECASHMQQPENQQILQYDVVHAGMLLLSGDECVSPVMVQASRLQITPTVTLANVGRPFAVANGCSKLRELFITTAYACSDGAYVFAQCRRV